MQFIRWCRWHDVGNLFFKVSTYLLKCSNTDDRCNLKYIFRSRYVSTITGIYTNNNVYFGGLKIWPIIYHYVLHKSSKKVIYWTPLRIIFRLQIFIIAFNSIIHYLVYPKCCAYTPKIIVLYIARISTTIIFPTFFF